MVIDTLALRQEPLTFRQEHRVHRHMVHRLISTSISSGKVIIWAASPGFTALSPLSTCCVSLGVHTFYTHATFHCVHAAVQGFTTATLARSHSPGHRSSGWASHRRVKCGSEPLTLASLCKTASCLDFSSLARLNQRKRTSHLRGTQVINS